MHHQLSTHGLYILSGPPGSGKSTFIKNSKNLPEQAIISTDQIRLQMFGLRERLNSQGMKNKVLSEAANEDVFLIASTMAEARLKEKLLTVIDATNINDIERNLWFRLAEKYGMPIKTIIMNTPMEKAIQNDQERERSVGPGIIREFHNNFEKTSRKDFLIVEHSDSCEFSLPTLKNNHVDVIGDIHGFFSETKDLIQSLGYSVGEDLKISHPENRKLLFMGDWIDRGPDPIKCFQMVYQAVKQDGHYAIPGNHEHKFYKSYTKWKNSDEFKAPSFSASETMLRFWKGVSRETLEEWMNWLNSLPPAYQHDRFMFAHADIASFIKNETPASLFFYGESNFGRLDTDGLFSQWSESQGEEGPILIRGHIPCTNPKTTRAFSLENKVGFNGEMKAIKLDEFQKAIALEKIAPEEAFKQKVTNHPVQFDFEQYQTQQLRYTTKLKNFEKQGLVFKTVNEKYDLKIFDKKPGQKMNRLKQEHLEKLKHSKLISEKTSQAKEPNKNLSIYKYSKKVFFDNLWSEDDLLLHTRGLVLDASGQIIQNPFVKVFNYGENGTGSDFPDETRVQAIEKINGFLGCITHHPYEEGLLITTTGSFDSVFVKMIEESLTTQSRALIQNYLKQKDRTLMFEVVHPKDPHIIEYKQEEMGLYLIGEREKNLNAPLTSERDLDVLAKQLEVKRPKHYTSTLGSIRNRAEKVKHEGYLLRDVEQGRPLLKLKSMYYLTTKFLGRMNEGNTKFMFENTQEFLKKVDEEYYPLVERLTQSHSFESFRSLSPVERVAVIRDTIKQTREASVQPIKNEKSNRPKCG